MAGSSGHMARSCGLRVVRRFGCGADALGVSPRWSYRLNFYLRHDIVFGEDSVIKFSTSSPIPTSLISQNRLSHPQPVAPLVSQELGTKPNL